MHILRQFQHIIGVAGFRTVDIVDKVHACLLAGEVFTTRVATEGQRTLSCDDVPEEVGSIVITLITREFADALEAHHLGNLCIGMHVVEIVQTLRHGRQQSAM